MAEIIINAGDTRKTTEDIRRWKEQKKRDVKAVLLKSAFKVETTAKQFCVQRFKEPSGRLQSSITIDDSDLLRDIIRVGTNVKYAPYVEHGHRQEPGRYVPAIGKRLVRSFVPGKPYLFPAFFMHEPEIKKELKKKFRKVK